MRDKATSDNVFVHHINVMRRERIDNILICHFAQVSPLRTKHSDMLTLMGEGRETQKVALTSIGAAGLQ